LEQELHPALTASGRFKVKDCLGQGGFGVVFSAFDVEANANIAIKWLRNSDASTIARFKREFRSLSDVVHPNLISFRELINVAGEWFLTMDLVDGVELLRWVRPASPINTAELPSEAATATDGLIIGLMDTVPGSITSPLSGSRPGSRPHDEPGHRPLCVADLPRVRNAFEQLASGLIALHKKGMLHRDVKPSNVLVARDGRVVLLDFGLVTEMTNDGVAATVTGNIVGTPAYMSPEQAMGTKLTPASDWYAVGVMLYQALTGKVPFDGEAHGLLLRKQLADPPPPNELVRGIPRSLAALCQQMIARAPEQRPGGPEIVERLRSAIGDGAGSRMSALGGFGTGVPISSPGPSVPGAVAAPFVGRETHLWALDEALEEVTRGGTVVAMVHGPSGMGKSALVKYYLETVRADRPEVVVLEGRCYERESVPYKALDSLVDSLCRYLQMLPDVEAAKLLPRDVAALARVFPVFLQFEGSAGKRSRARSRVDAMQERRRAFDALRELFARIADRAPLVLSIDDLQWGDGDSEPLLLSILRPPDPPALLLLAAYRSEDAETSPLVKALRRLATSGPPLEVCEVPVAELSPDAARELALSLLGPEVALDRATEMAEEARGSPLFLRQLAALGGSDERVDLKKALEKRVTALPPPARRLLETLAVSGRPLSLAVAARAAGVEEDPQGVLNTLRGETLARTRGIEAQDEVEVYHDRIREIVVASLSKDELKARHQKLARALSSTNEADAEALAEHFLAAGERDRAAEFAERAAERAETALAFTRAAEMYSMAIELSEQSDQAQSQKSESLVVKLAEALVNAGRGHEAGERFLQAAKGAAATNALDLRRRAAEQFLFSGHIEKGMTVVEQILAAMKLRSPKTPLGAVLMLIWRRFVLRIRGLGFRERSPDSLARDRLVVMDTCYSVGIGLAMIDPIRGQDFQTRYLLLALRAGEPLRIARGLALEAAYRAVGGVRVLAVIDQLLGKARSMADRLGNAHARALAALMHGVSRVLVGDYEQGVVLCDQAAGQLRDNCTGVAWELDNASFFAAFSLAQCGRLKELAGRIPELLEDAQSRGDLYADVFLRLQCTYLVALAQDDAPRALADLEVIGATWSVDRFLLQHAWRMVSLVDVALYRGDGEAAWKVIEETWPKLVASQLHRPQSMRVRARMARARAALATGRLEEAEKEARELSRERFPVARGWATLVEAGLREARGDVTGAVASYGEAAGALEEHKARLWSWAALHRRGTLLGGKEGERVVAKAEEAMKAEGVTKPSSMARMLAPVPLR
jgi:eukaryotic-like serine/threonine-protein kinase